MPDINNASEKAHLFLVSTPLHLMVSLAIIDKLAISSPHLVFIDQVQGKTNPYIEVLQKWPESPFVSISVFYRPVRSALKKLRERRKTFAELSDLVVKLKPGHIYTGNDRRIEFQLCMHEATRVGINPRGYYMDEGTFTYVGRKASSSFSDKYIDNTIKKLFYGGWWKHPETVGSSEWISAVYVSMPEHIHPLLKQKRVIQLTLADWKSNALRDFCERLIDSIGRPERLEEFEVIITLPHESIMHANHAYKKRIEQLVSELYGNNIKLAVKYHPRDTHADMLGISNYAGVDLINSALPFEALLPLFKNEAKVIGDFSTTLITTRLLRPDITVEAIDHGASDQSAQFIDLYKAIGIKIVQ